MNKLILVGGALVVGYFLMKQSGIITRRFYGNYEAPTYWLDSEHVGPKSMIPIARRHGDSPDEPATPWNQYEHVGSNENHIIGGSYNNPANGYGRVYVGPGAI